jgi:DNA-binding response OmpR family regulator
LDEAPIKPMVLVVDDHEDNARLLAQIVRNAGYETLCAPSCAGAMQIARNRRVRILITDLDLPDGDGCDLLCQVRTLHPTIVGLAFTGHSTWNHRARCEVVGFRGMLIKPVSIEEVHAALKSATSQTIPVPPPAPAATPAPSRSDAPAPIAKPSPN